MSVRLLRTRRITVVSGDSIVALDGVAPGRRARGGVCLVGLALAGRVRAQPDRHAAHERG